MVKLLCSLSFSVRSLPVHSRQLLLKRTFMTSPKRVSLSFEVYGKVQGVFFRAYTKKKADELGLHGWVQNTSKGTVKGIAQGEAPVVEQFKNWVSKEGSPASQITKCDCSLKEITKYDFSSFQVAEDD